MHSAAKLPPPPPVKCVICYGVIALPACWNVCRDNVLVGRIGRGRLRWLEVCMARGRFIAHILYTYELVCQFVCELSGKGAAKGGFKGQEVCVQSVVDLRGRNWW